MVGQSRRAVVALEGGEEMGARGPVRAQMQGRRVRARMGSVPCARDGAAYAAVGERAESGLRCARSLDRGRLSVHLRGEVRMPRLLTRFISS